MSNLLTIRRPCKAVHHCCTFPAVLQCACVSVDDISPPHFSLLRITNQHSSARTHNKHTCYETTTDTFCFHSTEIRTVTHRTTDIIINSYLRRIVNVHQSDKKQQQKVTEILLLLVVVVVTAAAAVVVVVVVVVVLLLLLRLRPVDGDPCQASCLVLFQHVTTAAQHSSTGTDSCFPTTGHCASSQPAGLL